MNFKKHLTEGAILDIYLYPFEQKEFRGKALLLKREIDKEPRKKQKIFLFKEYRNKMGILREYYCNYEIWIIRFLDGPQKGFKTIVKIPFKHKILDKDE